MKVGDKVVVTKELYGHRFDIGQVVTCAEISDAGLSPIKDPSAGFDSDSGDRWWMQPEEYKLLPDLTLPDPPLHDTAALEAWLDT